MTTLWLVLVMYPTAVGVLWITSRMLAPAGYQFSLWPAIGTAFALSIVGKLLGKLLTPLIGEWYVLIQLLAHALIVKFILVLPFWRSTLVAVIYIAVVAVVYYFLFARPG